MNGLLDFIKTPEGQGLLSAAFGGLAGAQRGAPLNSIGRAGLAGLAGYGNAIDRQDQQANAEFNQQYRTMQMEQIRAAQEKAKAEQAWRSKLPELMAPTLQGQTPQAKMLLDQMGPDATPEDVAAMNQGARIPATGFQYAQDQAALRRHLMDANSPFAGEILKQELFPTADDYKVVGGDLVRIGKGGVTVAHQSQRPDNVPSDQKLYNLAKDQGFTGTFMDFLRERIRTTEGAKAGFDLVEITTPEGTAYKVPRSVAVRMAGGNSNQTDVKTPVVNGYAGGSASAASGGQRDILMQERAKAVASGNAADVEAIDRELSRLSGASQTPGIRVQSEVEKAAATQRAKDEASGKRQETESARAAQVASIDAQISAIDKALAHPGRATATGLSGSIDPRNYIPGTDARDFQVVLDQLGGAAFLQAFESLKGGGQITEVEGRKATDAIARLNRAQSDKEFEASLRELRGIMEAGRKRLSGAGGASASFDQPAQRQVKRTGVYGGRKVIEYTNGDVEYAN